MDENTGTEGETQPPLGQQMRRYASDQKRSLPHSPSHRPRVPYGPKADERDLPMSALRVERTRVRAGRTSACDPKQTLGLEPKR
jgi:hypothetical protein